MKNSVIHCTKHCHLSKCAYLVKIAHSNFQNATFQKLNSELLKDLIMQIKGKM